MKCNTVKLRAARDRHGMTQEMLAAQAKVDVRTVQRAEAGAPLRQETIADLAAVLGVPLSGLVAKDDSETDRGTVQSFFGPGLVLRRTAKGREVIELLETTRIGKLECDADPTEDIIDVLRGAIRFIEGMLPDPWDAEGQTGALSFSSLVDRLEAIAKMTETLADLERHGLTLFCGSTWERAVMPRWGEEGLYTRTGQRPESVRATRLLIAQIGGDRITVQRDIDWPVKIEPEEPIGGFPEGLDDDVPF